MTVSEIEEGVEKGAMDKTEKEGSVKTEDKADESGQKEAGTKKADQDVVFVQDVGFTVKIVSPNLEPFDVQVSCADIFYVVI
jgi:protein TIF31